MRLTSRAALCGQLAIIGLFCSPAAVTAAPLPAMTFASNADAPLIRVGKYWDEDDDYYYPPEYYLPPPPPPVVRVVPAPPIAVYEPPVYGWLSPPRPSNCGKYRYWNGEYCADARKEPPYIGPRW